MPLSKTGCPDPETLASLVRGTLPRRRRSEVERHLSRCGFCLDSVSSCASLESLPIRRLQGRHLGLSAAVAAAVLLGIGAATWSLWPSHESRVVLPGPEGELPIWTLSAALSTGPGETRSALLPDGSRLTLGAQSLIVSFPTEAGGRWRLGLQAGQVEIAVAPGKGEARLSSSAGEVQVLGTRFRARAFRLHLLSAVEDVLTVDLLEGRVRLSNPQGNLVLQPGNRGLLLAGEPPVQQEAAAPQEGALLDFLGAFRPREEWGSAPAWIAPGREEAARRIAASLWGGEHDGDHFWPALLHSGATPRIREGAALLIGICGSDGELASLTEASASEPDPAVRRSLSSILARRREGR